MPSRAESNTRPHSSQNMARSYENAVRESYKELGLRQQKRRMSLQESELFHKFCTTFLSNDCPEVTDSGFNISINIAVEPSTEKDSGKAYSLSDATTSSFNDREVKMKTGNKTKNRMISKPVRRQSDVTTLCSNSMKAERHTSECNSDGDIMYDDYYMEPSINDINIRRMSSTSVLSSDLSDTYSNEHSNFDGNGCQNESPSHRRRSKAKGSCHNSNEESFIVVSTEKIRRMSASTLHTINQIKTKVDSAKQQGRKHEDVGKTEAILNDVRQKIRKDSFELRREIQDFRSFRTPKSGSILTSAERQSKREEECKKATQSSQNIAVKGYLATLSQERLSDDMDYIHRPRCQSESRRLPSQPCCHGNRRTILEYNGNGEPQCSKSIPNTETGPKLRNSLPLPQMKQRLNLPSGHLDGLVCSLTPTEEVPSPKDKRVDNGEETTKFPYGNIDYNCENAPQVKCLATNPPFHQKTGPPERSPALGSIKLKIQYLIITKRLKVTIVKASGLPLKKVRNTYARACLMPGKLEKQNSKVVKKSINPVYDSTMYFHDISLENMHDKVVRIKIMAKQSKFRRATPTGEVRIKMDKLDLVSESCLEEDLKPYFPEDEKEPYIKWSDTCSELDTDDFNWD